MNTTNLITISSKIPSLKSFYHFGRPRVLPVNYTFIISTQCNSQCKTCNIWKQPQHDELTLEEWEKTLKSIGRAPFWITISGGEPFLQPHLVDFCRLIFEVCQPAILNIPTNCLVWETIPQKVEEILKASHLRSWGSSPPPTAGQNDGGRYTSVVINLSLDGVGEKHDQIRGVRGNFRAFEKTYQSLKQLQQNHQNLTVGVHSVISKFNVDDVDELFSYIAELNPDQYITEIAEERKELGTLGADIIPSHEEYSQIIGKLEEKTVEVKPKRLTHRHSEAPSLRSRTGSGRRIPIRTNEILRPNKSGLRMMLNPNPRCDIHKITKTFRSEYYNLVKWWLKEKQQIIPCYAGAASCQISSGGEVWPCCVRGDNLGNLRDHDYDFKKIWFSKKTNEVRKSIKNGDCSCPLANAGYTNMLMHLPTAIKVGRAIISSE